MISHKQLSSRWGIVTKRLFGNESNNKGSHIPAQCYFASLEGIAKIESNEKPLLWMKFFKSKTSENEKTGRT
jgi:hypothetical protein